MLFHATDRILTPGVILISGELLFSPKRVEALKIMKDKREPGESLPDELDVAIRNHEVDVETAIPEITIRAVIRYILFVGTAMNDNQRTRPATFA